MAKTTKVGAAWKRETPDGKPYFSLVINNPIGPDFNFTLWPVAEKRSENSPDFDVTKQSDAAKREAAAGSPARSASPLGFVKPGPAQTADDFPGDDVPF